MNKYYKINLNDHIKVKLTDYGRDIYYNKYGRLPETDYDGYVDFQLWTFMELYADQMHVLSKDVIYHNEIIICEE